MDTLLILRDTITVNAFKVIDSFPVCVKEAETNWEDVALVGSICLAVVLVLLIVANAFCKWQRLKYENLVTIEKEKYEHEIKKANNEAEIRKGEKEDELKHWRCKSEFDLNKEQMQKINKTDYERAGEFIKQMCDATKDKDGKLDKDTKKILWKFLFGEEEKTDETKETGECNNEEPKSEDEGKES